MFNARRAVQVRHSPASQSSGQPTRFASGYAIGDGFILTCDHVLLPDDQSNYTITVTDSEFRDCVASVVWRNRTNDVALLKVADPTLTALEPVPLGALPESSEGRAVSFVMFGWPRAGQDEGDPSAFDGPTRHGIRNGVQVDGVIKLAEMRGVKIALRPDEDYHPLSGGTLWAGMSGAAVVCQEHVIAIQTRQPQSLVPAYVEACAITEAVLGQRDDNDRTASEILADAGFPALSLIDLGSPGTMQRTSLPEEPPHFTGRHQQLQELVKLFTQTPDPESRSRRALLSGYPGVGKTDLAIHCAYRLREQYPDGQLYVDLQGYSEHDKKHPSEVLADWLVSFWGRARTGLPRTVDALAAEFRSNLAVKRILLVLDNAADVASVTPLLPGNPDCGVLVTSRNSMAQLQLRRFSNVHVETLSDDEGADLLHAYLRDVTTDRVALRRLAAHCGGLPLAMQIVAGRIRGSGHSPADQADQLDNESRRFDLISKLPDGTMDLTRLFSLSYNVLSSNAQRLFRLFGLHPAAGSTTDTYCMATLSNLDYGEAQELLTVLKVESLIAYTGGGYSTHDLLRSYAEQLVDRPEHRAERREALKRLAQAFYGCINHAFDKLNPENPMVDLEFLANWRKHDQPGVDAVERAGGGHTWFTRERANILKAVRAAAAASPPLEITARLACGMFYLLEVSGRLDDWNEVELIAQRASEASRDRQDLAFSLRNRGRLAMVHVLTDYQERLRDDDDSRAEQRDACQPAILLLEQAQSQYLAKEIAQERWARAGYATTVRELADAYRLQVAAAPSTEGAQRSIELYLDAKRVYQTLNSASGLASLAQALGQAYVLNNQYDRAEECYLEALAFGQTLNENGKAQHPRLKGFTLRRLGDLRQLQYRHSDAAMFYQQCAETFLVDLDDPINRARALALRGRALRDEGDTISACAALVDAETLLRQHRTADNPEFRVIAKWKEQSSAKPHRAFTGLPKNPEV